METSLIFDDKSRQLGLLFKKRFEHSSDVSLKVRGVLNTVTAQGSFNASLRKFFRVGRTPSFSASDPFQPDTRLRLGIGAKASGVNGKAPSSDDTAFSLSAKKKFVLNKRQEVVRNRVLLRSYSQASLAASYDYNMRTERWSGELAGADLRITAGVRAPVSDRGMVGRAEPFLRLQENCWGLTIDRRGNWTATYDL
eukprot:scaffold12.g7997.t1